jgi:hypothetical protein
MGPVLLLAIMSTAYTGFALLALSQDRNWAAVAHASLLSRWPKLILRATGYTLLAFGLWPAIWRDGAGFGSLLWATSLSIAAVAVVLTLSWRPALLRPVARVIGRVAA